MTEGKRVLLSFFAIYHSRGKEEQRKIQNLAPCRRQCVHVEFLTEATESNIFETLKSANILMACTVAWPVIGVSA